MRSYYRNQEITKVKIPTAEEERQMFEEYRERRTAGRREKIVLCYLQFALRQARKDMGLRAASMRSRPGMSEDDSISAANLGLMEAINRFDPSRGFRFTTYAGFWIFKYLLEARYAAHQIVVSDAEKRLFSRLSAMKRRLGLTEEEISKQTGIPEGEVDRILSLASGRCESLGSVAQSEGWVRGKAAAGVELVVSGPEEDIERREQIALLRSLIEDLPVKSRDIVRARYFQGLKNVQISKRLKVSEHTVERVLREAKETLKKGLSHA